MSAESFRRLMALLIGLVPASEVKNALYRSLLGYQIAPGVRIGFSLLHGRHIDIGAGTRIGNLNNFKDLYRMRVGARVHIGHRNRIISNFALCFEPEFTLGDGASITNSHYFDVVDNVTIGAECVIGGMGSQFWTHGFDVERNRLQAPLDIAPRCYLGSAVIMNPGVRLGPRTLVGAGTVVTKSFPEAGSFIGGNPARFLQSHIVHSDNPNAILIKEIGTSAFYRKAQAGDPSCSSST